MMRVYSVIMTTTEVESQLALLERELFELHGLTPQQRAPLLTSLAARFGTLYDELEMLIGKEGLQRTDQPLIPLFQRWMQSAREVITSVREVRAAGVDVPRVTDLAFAINCSKAVALDFDRTVSVNEQLARGEYPARGRPLKEILDELQARVRSAG
jgi:hypothetical protein